MEINTKFNTQFLKGTLVRGTLVLTFAGFLTRIIGFFYRVFLADLMGEALLGIYQLIFSVYGICFTIYGAGIQTAISQIIASNTKSGEEKQKKDRSIFLCGLSLSLLLALLLSAFVFFFSGPIAAHFLLEPACSTYLKILCLLFPFCGVSACINGYFFGKKQAKVPAISQIIEQLARVCSVFLICMLFHARGTFSCKFATAGVVIGEFAACVYNVIKLLRAKDPKESGKELLPEKTVAKKSHSLFFLAGTLTGTKLILALLHSAEAIFIPAALKEYGYTGSEALALFGVFSGIALPFILFPASLTNSFAVMLLPSIAEAHANGYIKKIRSYVTKSSRYSLIPGYFFTALFLFFGNYFGTAFFHSKDAGYFITMLSFLCPFLYLSTTLTSIINGLGKTGLTFFITTSGLAVKLFFLIVLVPKTGIQAYLFGMLLSQILMTVWEWYYLRNYMELSVKKYFFYPALFFLLLGTILKSRGFF